MAEYIDRKSAIALAKDIIVHIKSGYDYRHRCIDPQDLAELPAADVRPVVKARWIGYPECLKYTNAYSDDHIVCSACEECFSILGNDCERFNFCPNCGAQMIEGDDDV